MMKFLSLLMSAIMLLPAAGTIGTAPPDAKILAPYYIVVDADDPSIVFYEKDADDRCIPASTMKIMTCILTLENVKDLDDTVVITKQAASMKETNSLMHVLAGETLSIRQLLYGMMLVSGNDAAMTLANYVAGSVAAFAELANAKAAELGMTTTHFTNASGAFNGKQYSTARDMALLMSYALKNEMFRTLISTARYTIEPNDVRKEPLELVNSNRLISDDPESDCYSALCIGGKTGSTDRGGDCLVAVGQLDGARVIVVLIGADDTNHRDANKRMPRVFQNGKLFIEYTLQNDYAAVTPDSLGVSYADEVTPSGMTAPLSVSAQFDEGTQGRLPKVLADKLAADPSALEATAALDEGLSAVQPGDAVGTVTYSYAGRALFSGRLVADAGSPAFATPTSAPIPETPVPEPANGAAETLGQASPGVYVFAGISALLFCSLMVLIVLNIKSAMNKKKKTQKPRRYPPVGGESPARAAAKPEDSAPLEMHTVEPEPESAKDDFTLFSQSEPAKDSSEDPGKRD
ncbi:MAG: D-alanyl-D-alanine carboxypeptidase family protein [Christensenella sp.]|nr:D-alanyl-D-alanine carboxypeptidase family protein [Christensenella sp.]